MSPGHSKEDTLRRIEMAIRRIPDEEPPEVLLESVMRSVRARKLPIWTRLLRWSKSPRSITVTPLRLIPAACLLIALLIGGVFHVVRDERERLAQNGSRVSVVLALRVPDAKSVAVIGSFNGWQPQKCELTALNGESAWSVTLVLPSGRYQYAFLVDGERIVPDPGAGLHEDDGFGSQNAILLVGNEHGSSI